MAIDSGKLQQLREMTSAGMLDCKKALEETDGDVEKAADLLRKRGIIKAVKKMDREASEGGIFSYVHHNNKIGVLVRINCETDFVARNEMFHELGKNIAMHIAASNPACVNPEEVSTDAIEKEKEIQREALLKEGKPADKIDKILQGKIDKYVAEASLLKQAFVKDPSITVEDLIKQTISKLGENISVQKFIRYSI